MLFLVSYLRLEIANHTMVLGSAVLPLTNQLVPQIHPFLAALSRVGVRHINVGNDKSGLWRIVLPALVERCRQWEHCSSYEYKAKAQIPLSVKHGQPLLCSCRDGRLPPRFISGIPKWDLVSKYAIQAAISPSFSISFVKQIFKVNRAKKAADIFENRCQNCLEQSSDGVNLLRCSQCRVVKYCSPKC